MHRNLAGVVEEPELRARHLALATTSADPLTLQSLDEAAEMARIRGAPDAAAELVELALGLGGDTPERRIRSANHHMDAGDSWPCQGGTRADHRAAGGGPAARGCVVPACHRAPVRRQLRPGRSAVGARARRDRRRSRATRSDVGHAVVCALQRGPARSCGHQRRGRRHRCHTARASASAESGAGHAGDGVLPARRRRRSRRVCERALELEDREAAVPSAFRPSAQSALLRACTGQLEQAHEEIRAVRRHYVDRGEESELVFVDFNAGMLEIWRGDFTEASRGADHLMERALQLGGDLPRCVSLTVRAALAAYAGRVDQARADATEALAAAQRSSSRRSVGVAGHAPRLPRRIARRLPGGAHHPAVAGVARLDAAPDGTEIIAAAFMPDAVEAMIAAWAVRRRRAADRAARTQRQPAGPAVDAGRWRPLPSDAPRRPR